MTLLSAQTLSLKSGWNLVGAVEDINASEISCAQTVWTYDTNGTWSLYQTMNTSDNYGYPQLDNINQGTGFWVNANSDCSITSTKSGISSTLKYTDEYLNSEGVVYVLYRAWNETLDKAGDWTVSSLKMENGKTYETVGSFVDNPSLSDRTYIIEDGKIKENDNGDIWYETIISVNSDYIEGCSLEIDETYNGLICQEQAKTYRYFDETKAKAELQSRLYSNY